MSVAEQLAAVDSAAALDALLRELAADPECRWRRTQIFFYLPAAFHRLAAEYFRGEMLSPPERRRVQVESVDPVALEEALASLFAWAGAEPECEPAPLRDEVPRLDAILRGEHGDDDVERMLAALAEEARAVDRETPKRYRLRDGVCTGPQNEWFAYRFTWSSEPDLMVPGDLLLGERTLAARVGRQADGEKQFELLVETFLGTRVKEAVFRVDPTFLLRAQYQLLSSRRDLYERGRGVAGRLGQRPDALPPTGAMPVPFPTLNGGQRQAVAAARVSERAYVWGPPGTGKTTSLGHLIRDLVDGGQRVLVVSPYNVAVDEAVLSAARIGTWGAEELVRFGRVSDAVRRAGVDLDSLLEARAERTGLLAQARAVHAAVARALGAREPATPASVRRCIEGLGEMVIQLGTDSAGPILKAVRLLRERFRQPEGAILRDARIAGTTVSLAMVSPLVFARGYDHVIVDEASVVRTPEAVLVALLAGAPVTFFGDPRQLPSIVRARSPLTDRWMRPSPFAMAGIHRPEDAKGACVMLTEQHRMAPPIRALVSELFYAGALRDGNAPREGRVVLLDTSATPARATTRWVKMSASRENLVHRGIVGSLLWALREAHPNAAILVLSPFVAQKKAYEREASTGRVPGVRFATVHSSQGTESEIVVLDLVIAPGRGRSRFMDETRTPEFPNLLNVGISRAKRQLILIGHAEHVAMHYPGRLLDRMLRMVRERFEAHPVPEDLRLRELLELIAYVPTPAGA